MHRVFFGIKRAHWRVVALSFPFVVGAGLTPARFDMLRAIRGYPGGILQRNLQYLLGVSRATVSRMLLALEQQGLIWRALELRDRRCLAVYITKDGIESVEQALKEAIHSGAADRLSTLGVTGELPADRDEETARTEVAVFEDVLLRMRRVFHDPSPVRHPWKGGESSFIESLCAHAPRPCALRWAA